MATLEESSGGSHVHKIFEAFGRRKDKLRDKEIEEATEEAYELFASIPKETVQDIADSFGATLQPSLKELLDGFLNTTAEDIDTSEFLRALLEKYNETVRLYRESQG
ncbi:hypothetical protein [uncultured Thiodictyon sp.]|jgi:hypothetical protein|uniref:hypothetical protein n=1 Tax=uncultured Thiodictyon sp. TaxID=1846217 RepID=UPI0025E9CC8C|nr:hypothetical protein [uncultured Thiodictyon sp.]